MEPIRVERVGALVVTTFPEAPTVEAVGALFDKLDAVLAEGRPFALLLDASRVKKTDSAVRDLAVKRLKSKAAERKRLLLGEAVVVPSALVRGMLAAMYVVVPPGYPTKTFSEVAEARRWLTARLG